MATKKSTRKLTKKSEKGDSIVSAAVARLDGWMNALSGLNTSRDRRTAAEFKKHRRLSQEREVLEEIFHGDDLAARIVELPAQEMTRAWFDLLIQDDDGSEVAADVMQSLDRLGAKRAVTDAIVWARLYGGAVIMLGAEDGGEPRDPLKLENVRSLDWLNVLDRYEVQVESYYTDETAEKFGMPELYRINTVGGGRGADVGEVVHESRMLRFNGVRTGRRRRQELNGWSDSVLTRQIDIVRDFHGSFDSMAHMLTVFSQAVYKIDGLSAMLAADNDELVLKRLQMLDLARSVVRAVPLDSSEEYDTRGQSVTGMSDLLDRLMMRVSAASGIPVTLLFGRSPAGMNATGESDIRLFYDSVAARQEAELRDPLWWLLSVLLHAKDGPTGGKAPESWGFSFNSLYQESAKERAEARREVAEADRIYIEAGVLSPDEVATSRFGGDTYSAETVLDLEQRAADAAAAEDAARATPLPVVDRGDALTGMDAAPNYRDAADGEPACLSCFWQVGGICERFSFTTSIGATCDEYKPRTPGRVIDG